MTADPFEAWRKIYEANQATWSEAALEHTSSEAWVKAQSRMLETILGFQKSASDAMGAYLAAMNLPSRADVARLGELILSLEEKVDQLDDRLASVDRRPAEAKAAKPAAAPKKRTNAAKRGAR